MSKRQLSQVIDLNKCIGCHTCTISCKKLWTDRNGREYMYWNNVETKPGKGYPKDWEKRGGGFKKGVLQAGDEVAPLEDYGLPWEYDNMKASLMEGTGEQVLPHHEGKKVWPTWGPNWDEDQGEGMFPNSYYFYLPRICNHCSKPACLAACTRKAIYKREEDGIVLVDQKRCRGYRYCVRACPYKKTYFNSTTNTSEKCIFCYPRIEKGEVQGCANQCVGRVRHVSWMDDKDGPAYKLVKKWKVALPLHPEFETEPNVFYIPPINTTPPPLDSDGKLMEGKDRIPLSYLESLFGPKVKGALDVLSGEMEKRKKGQPSELTEILIGYTNKDRFKL